jgi:hypothetical protein
VDGYKTIDSILDALTDDFAVEFLELNGINKNGILNRYNFLNLPSAPSVSQALVRFTEITKEIDANANMIFMKNAISSVSDNLALVVTEYPNMIVDEEIDIADFTVPSIHKVMKLASFVGKDENGAFLLNSGTPVLVFYTATSDFTESQFFVKAQELYKSNIKDIVRTLDFSGFQPDPMLALVLMTKFDSKEMFRRGLDSSEFVSSLFEMCIMQIGAATFDDESEKLILRAATLFEDPELLFTLALESLKNPQSARIMAKILIVTNTDINSIIENLGINSISVEPIMDILDANMHGDFSEGALSILSRSKALQKFIINKEKDEYIKYILPVKSSDVNNLINNCSREYAAKVLIQNGDKNVAALVKSKFIGNPEFVAFVGQRMSALEAIDVFIKGDENEAEDAIYAFIKDVRENGVTQEIFLKIDNLISTILKGMIGTSCFYYLFIAIGDFWAYFDNNVLISIFHMAALHITKEAQVNRLLDIIKYNYRERKTFIDITKMLMRTDYLINDMRYKPYKIEMWIHNFLRQNDSASPTICGNLLTKVYMYLTEDCIKRIGEDICENLPILNYEMTLVVIMILTSVHRFLLPLVETKGFYPFSAAFALIPIVGVISLSNSGLEFDFGSIIALNDAVIEKILSYDEMKDQHDCSQYLKFLSISKLDIMSKISVQKKPYLMHLVTNLIKINSEVMDWATEPQYIKITCRKEYSEEFAYFAETLFIEASADAESKDDPMLFIAGEVLLKALRNSIEAGVWNDINRLLNIYNLAIKSSAKEVVTNDSFTEYFSALQYIPLNSDVSYLKMLTMLIIKEMPQSYDVDGVKSFFNSFVVDKGEALRLAIAVILVKKSPPNKLPLLKNDAIKVFTKLLSIKEFEKQCKQIIDSFK